MPVPAGAATSPPGDAGDPDCSPPSGAPRNSDRLSSVTRMPRKNVAIARSRSGRSSLRRLGDGGAESITSTGDGLETCPGSGGGPGWLDSDEGLMLCKAC